MRFPRPGNAGALKNHLQGSEGDKGDQMNRKCLLSNLLPVGQSDYELGDLWTGGFVLLFVYLVAIQIVSIDCRFGFQKSLWLCNEIHS